MLKNKKLLLFLSLILFALFIFYSYLVSKELFTQTDFNTTVKFQDHISRRFDLPFSVLSLIGSVEVTVLIWALLSLFLLVKKFWKAFLAMSLLPIALAIELFGKLFVLHPAPPHLFYRGVIKFDFPSSFVQTDFSYPSGHVTRIAFLVLFAITYFLLRDRTKTKWLFIPGLAVFLVLMMVSRIYLGEHWTTDVIGGLLIGSSFGILAGTFLPSSRNSGTL